MIEGLKKHMTPILFAVAYAAFMGVSIPKVGTMFLLYSEGHSPVWVAASYGAAVTIDALIGFLTYATTSKQREWGTQLGIWLFVLIFAAYSFYFNWIYDELHLPPASSVWSLPSIIPGWDVQQLTTMLVSAVPLGILGFTLIARLIREEKHTVSLEELRQAAANVAERAALQQVIDTANVGRGISWAKMRIQAGKAMLSELAPSKQESDRTSDAEQEPVTPIEEVQQDLPEKLQKTIVFLADNPNGTDEELAEFLGLLRPSSARFWRLKAVEIGGNTEVTQEQTVSSEPEKREVLSSENDGNESTITAETPKESELQNGENAVTIPGYEDVLNAYPIIASWLTSGLRTVPIDRVITDLHMSRKKLNNRIADGTLKRASRNQERVTLLSLLEFLKTELSQEQKAPITRKLPALKIIQNGHKQEPITGELPSAKLVPTEQEKAS